MLKNDKLSTALNLISHHNYHIALEIQKNEYMLKRLSSIVAVMDKIDAVYQDIKKDDLYAATMSIPTLAQMIYIPSDEDTSLSEAEMCNIPPKKMPSPKKTLEEMIVDAFTLIYSGEAIVCTSEETACLKESVLKYAETLKDENPKTVVSSLKASYASMMGLVPDLTGIRQDLFSSHIAQSDYLLAVNILLYELSSKENRENLLSIPAQDWLSSYPCFILENVSFSELQNFKNILKIANEYELQNEIPPNLKQK